MTLSGQLKDSLKLVTIWYKLVSKQPILKLVPHRTLSPFPSEPSRASAFHLRQVDIKNNTWENSEPLSRE